MGGLLAITLLRDGLLRPCSGSDPAKAVLVVAFPSDRIAVVAAMACPVPFLLDSCSPPELSSPLGLPPLASSRSCSNPAAPLGCHPPWGMKLQCLALVAAFLLGVSSAVCTRLPPSASVLAGLRLPAWSSVHSWLLPLRSSSVRARGLLLAPAPVFLMFAPVCRGAVVDARLGLA